jgi:hypothetical protein
MRIIPIGFLAPNTGAIFVGALDPHTSGLWSVFGLKRMLSSYSGALVRLRRGSDNAEQDIGYLPDGTLDSAAALSFAGAGSAYLVRAYDQSGNANHFDATESSRQPVVINVGTYPGVIIFDGLNDILTTATMTPAVSALTFAGRYRLRSISDTSKTQSIITHGNAGFTGHSPMLYQHQGVNNKTAAYLFENGTYTAKDFAGFSTAEVADVLVGNRALAGTARINLWRGGASIPGDAADLGISTANFTAERVSIGAVYPENVQYAQMDAKWFAVWGVEKSASAAAISLAL